MTSALTQHPASSRINITLDLETGDASPRRELPLKLLFLGDFDKAQHTTPIRHRQRMRIDGARLQTVLGTLKPTLDLSIGLNDETVQPIHLQFHTMQDFHPNALAEQIPILRDLVAMRHLLKELKASVMDRAEFRRTLSVITQNPETRQQLTDELHRLTPCLNRKDHHE